MTFDKSRSINFAKKTVILLGAFAFGYFLATCQSSARLKVVKMEIKAIQTAVDFLQHDYSPATKTVGHTSTLEFSKSITAALLGHNPSINASNRVYLSIIPDRVKNGLIESPIGNFYGFRVIAAYDNGATATNRLVVVSDF